MSSDKTMIVKNIAVDGIVRSQRRTVGIEVKPGGNVIVRAPKNAPLSMIHSILLKNRDWIKEKKKIAEELRKELTPKKFGHGEEIYYLGQPHRLHIVSTAQKFFIKGKGFFISEAYKGRAREMFVAWFKKRAMEKLSRRVEFYAQKFGLRYRRIRITDADKRWGSCGKEGNLCFSWKMMFLPPAIINYIIVHELAHLRQMNHSPKFWAEVAEMMPDYKIRLKWLKENELKTSVF